jgi:hypothetical protein
MPPAPERRLRARQQQFPESTSQMPVSGDPYPVLVTSFALLKPMTGSSIPLLALGAAESAVCIMAASIPILRALARGNPNVPRGYQTGYPTGMTEPGQTMSLSLPIHVPPPPRPERELEGRHRNKPHSASSDGTSTLIMVTETPGHGKDEDLTDEDSIEMKNYRSRPQSPVDFTRSIAS